MDMHVLALAFSALSFLEPLESRIDDSLDRWRMRSWQLSGCENFHVLGFDLRVRLDAALLDGQTVSFALQNHLPNQTLDFCCLRTLLARFGPSRRGTVLSIVNVLLALL